MTSTWSTLYSRRSVGTRRTEGHDVCSKGLEVGVPGPRAPQKNQCVIAHASLVVAGENIDVMVFRLEGGPAVRHVTQCAISPCFRT